MNMNRYDNDNNNDNDTVYSASSTEYTSSSDSDLSSYYYTIFKQRFIDYLDNNNKDINISDHIYIDEVMVNVNKLQKNVKEVNVNITLIIDDKTCIDVDIVNTYVLNGFDYSLHLSEITYSNADPLLHYLNIEHNDTLENILYEIFETTP